MFVGSAIHIILDQNNDDFLSMRKPWKNEDRRPEVTNNA